MSADPKDEPMTPGEWLDLFVASMRALPGLTPFLTKDGDGDPCDISVGPRQTWDKATVAVLRAHYWEPASDGYLWSFPLPPKGLGCSP